MKEAFSVEQELEEIQYPDDVLLHGHLKTFNAESQYKDWNAPTKKEYLRQEIQKINLQLQKPLNILLELLFEKWQFLFRVWFVYQGYI